ncbi:MAG: patatin [Caldithrix sp.]|nr:patatin [Caldithrix sp.]
MFKNKKIGLALGGGAVLGAAHIGVIRAFEEFNISVDSVAGTSIGAMVAALYAFGKSWQDIKDIALDLDWWDISAMSLSQYGLLSNKKMDQLFAQHLGPVTFEDARIPLAIIATDVGKGEKVVLHKGSVSKAVMASTCIPGLFVPVEYEERLLVDGGVMENVPIPSIKEMKADYTIGVDLNASQSFKKPDNIIDVLINTINITLLHATKLQTEEADLIIVPDLSAFNVIDTDQVADLIEKGYEDTKTVLQKHFKI